MSNVDEYLSVRRSAIDRALDRYFKKQGRRGERIWEAMRYGVLSGGKRIRSILLLAAGELFGGKRRDLMPIACAVEMTHAYSLIHDDLPVLDDDDMRRGKPTVHKVFGDGLALLAGDGLLTEAFAIMASPGLVKSFSSELAIQLIRELSYAAGAVGLVGGQAADIEAEKHNADLTTVEDIHLRKSAALFLASVRMGACAGGATGADLKRISRYGESLGLAFQIADDLLDQQGDSCGACAESGNKEFNKATYPSVVGIDGAKNHLQKLLVQCVEPLRVYGATAQPLRGIAHYVVARALGEEISLKTQELRA